MQTGEHPGRATRLEALARDFAHRLRREFAQEIASSPREFKKRVVGLIRRELPPGPGRPGDPRYDQAARMADQGKTVAAILRCQDPQFDALDPWTRMLASRGLRAALRRRGRPPRRFRNPHPKKTTP